MKHLNLFETHLIKLYEGKLPESIIRLKQYLCMSDESKAEDLLCQFYYWFADNIHTRSGFLKEFDDFYTMEEKYPKKANRLKEIIKDDL